MGQRRGKRAVEGVVGKVQNLKMFNGTQIGGNRTEKLRIGKRQGCDAVLGTVGGWYGGTRNAVPRTRCLVSVVPVCEDVKRVVEHSVLERKQENAVSSESRTVVNSEEKKQ